MSNDLTDFDELFAGVPAQPPSPTPSPEKHVGHEARKEVRTRVNWRARVLLPPGILEVRLRDLSASGVGLIGSHNVRRDATLTIAIAVPSLNEPGKFSPISGKIKVSHCTIRGADISFGGVWVELASDARGLLQEWLRRLG